MGTGKLAAGSVNKWFKLGIEDKFRSVKTFIEKNIENHLRKLLDKILIEADHENWAPKQPMSGS